MISSVHNFNSFDNLNAKVKEQVADYRKRQSFSYDESKISKEDKSVMQSSLSKMNPLLTSFANSSDKDTTNLAFDINSLLPKAKDENHQNFINEELNSKFDAMTKAFKDAEKMDNLARDVFSQLSKQMESLTIYA